LAAQIILGDGEHRAQRRAFRSSLLAAPNNSKFRAFAAVTSSGLTLISPEQADANPVSNPERPLRVHTRLFYEQKENN
jgi:hypothetical protein